MNELNDGNIDEVMKAACPPVAADPAFRANLLNTLTLLHQNHIASPQPVPLYKRTLIWATVIGVLILALLIYSLWLPSTILANITP